MRILLRLLSVFALLVLCARCSCECGLDFEPDNGQPCTLGGCNNPCQGVLKCCYTRDSPQKTICTDADYFCVLGTRGQECGEDTDCASPYACVSWTCKCAPVCNRGAVCLLDEVKCTHQCCRPDQVCSSTRGEGCVSAPSGPEPSPDSSPDRGPDGRNELYREGAPLDSVPEALPPSPDGRFDLFE
jgi:hypothetical protein